ncbi:MAG: sulfotransferase [Planctomycetota bacterium]
MEEVPALSDDVLDLGRRLIPDPVFVLGCARSGTSIFGEALAAHSRVAYLFEASPIWNARTPERDDHRLVREDATGDVARELYAALGEAWNAEAASLGDDAVRLEKNPKHVLRVPFLDALFPTARFVHIIRDGRDVTASLMFRNRGERWGHLETPGWKQLLADFPKKNHIRCAHQWCDAVSLARNEGAALGDGRYFEVRYESLLENPLPTLEGVFTFLGLELDDSTREFATKIQNETAGSYHAKKQVRHYVENHERRVGRYLENLDEDQLREVEEVCGDLLHELGYER